MRAAEASADEREEAELSPSKKRSKLMSEEERREREQMGVAKKELMMQRYLVTVEYMGTRFFGWQKQNLTNCRTVQGVLEEAFEKFVGKPVKSSGSSRTDTGVHALGNVCHVDVERVSKRKPGEILPPHEPNVVKRAVNHFLQKDAGDVQVLDVQCIPLDFHSRFEAKERTYNYRILSGHGAVSIFEKDRAWHVPEYLDVASMQKACGYLLGHHDFSSFRAAGCQAKSPWRTLDELNIVETPLWPCFPTESEKPSSHEGHSCDPISDSPSEFARDLELQMDSGTPHCAQNNPSSKLIVHGQLGFGKHGSLTCYVIKARARSFLYHQVRLMVGLLKAVGTGALPLDAVQGVLNARTVTAVPPMAPACGLYLTNVKYEFGKLKDNVKSEDEEGE